MTVRDLISKLSELDGDTEVYLVTSSGNHWGTLRADALYDIRESLINIKRKRTQGYATLVDIDDDEADEENPDVIEAVSLHTFG